MSVKKIEQYGQLDGERVFVLAYYPEGRCYSWTNRWNRYGFAREHLITLE
mgnify:CR=1 FL=1